MSNRAYRSFADFTRQEIRPGLRAGWSVDDLEEPERDVDFDVDPIEAKLWDTHSDDDDDDDDE